MNCLGSTCGDEVSHQSTGSQSMVHRTAALRGVSLERNAQRPLSRAIELETLEWGQAAYVLISPPVNYNTSSSLRITALEFILWTTRKLVQYNLFQTTLTCLNFGPIYTTH